MTIQGFSANHIRSTAGDDGRQLNIKFEARDDNIFYAGEWQDLNCDGEFNVGDQLFYVPVGQGDIEWREVTEEDEEKFGEIMANEVNKWDAGLIWWRENASEGICNTYPDGSGFLTHQNSPFIWIHSGGVFLLHNKFLPPPYSNYIAVATKESPDYAILLSALHQCLDK